jgi:hypothetical protein
MRSSHLVTRVLALAVALSACSPPPSEDGAPLLSDTPLDETTVQETDSDGAIALQTTNPQTAAILPPRITTTSLPRGIVGTAYTRTIKGADGMPPYAFTVSAGVLPEGLQLSSSGELSGTPTTVGSQTFDVTLMDADGQVASRRYTFVVVLVLMLRAGTLPDAYRGRAYSQQLVLQGAAPYSFGVPSNVVLPPGLDFTSAGALAGTPRATGSVNNFPVTLSDAAGQRASGTLSFTLYALPAIVTSSYPGGQVGQAYSAATSVTGGKPPLSFSLATGALPGGIGLAPTTGQLLGTPTESGIFSFTVRVHDANGEESSKELQVSIDVPH